MYSPGEKLLNLILNYFNIDIHVVGRIDPINFIIIIADCCSSSTVLQNVHCQKMITYVRNNNEIMSQPLGFVKYATINGSFKCGIKLSFKKI